MQTKVNNPEELNISSTVTKTETEQRRRKAQGRVEDRNYTVQEYKALSNDRRKIEQLASPQGHNPKRRKFNKGSVKGQLAALEQQVSVLQSNHVTNAGTAQKAIQSGTPAHANASTNSENSNNHNILRSLVNKPDARLKGTKKLMDHLEEESLSHIKIQLDMQSGLPELALSPSAVNPTVS